MNIQLRIDFAPERVLTWLNTMVLHNADLMLAHPGLPLLYDSGVVYEREGEERFSDYLEVLKLGTEDCDSLAPARAGELVARGWRALGAGDDGFEVALRLRPSTIDAKVYLTTASRPGDPSPLYHVEVEYWLGGRRYTDDPSERLGMNGIIDPAVRGRWARTGARAGARFLTRNETVRAVSLGADGRFR